VRLLSELNSLGWKLTSSADISAKYHTTKKENGCSLKINLKYFELSSFETGVLVNKSTPFAPVSLPMTMTVLFLCQPIQNRELVNI